MSSQKTTPELYNYLDYKEFLNDYAQTQPRGFKTKLAESCGCQTGYISQVLQGDAHFSAEHSEAIARALGFAKLEMRYFFLLIQLARAGSAGLRALVRDEIEELQQKNLSLKDRVQIEATLPREAQGVYYSAWYYTAVHVAVSIPGFQTKEALAKLLLLSLSKISEILQFLCSAGLVKQTGDLYNVGATLIHLEKASPHTLKHHTNWRLHAIRMLENHSPQDVHYSGTFSLSESTFLKLQQNLVQMIQDSVAMVKDSKDEKMCTLVLDLFEW